MDSSLRCYIDVVQVTMIQNDVMQRGLRQVLEYAESHLAEFFPQAAACIRTCHGSNWVRADRGRTVAAALGRGEARSDPRGISSAAPLPCVHTPEARIGGRGRRGASGRGRGRASDTEDSNDPGDSAGAKGKGRARGAPSKGGRS